MINQLPEANKKVLILLANHLAKVQMYDDVNKMTMQNLGVCFGPTLLREQQVSDILCAMYTLFSFFETFLCNRFRQLN